MITIRVATEADAEEILAIYAKYIEQTAITFEYVVPWQDQAYIGAFSILDSGKGWKNRRLCLCQSVQRESGI